MCAVNKTRKCIVMMKVGLRIMVKISDNYFLNASPNDFNNHPLQFFFVNRSFIKGIN